MDLSILTNESVKGAIGALQQGDKSWYTYFVDQPEMTDDGRRVDFHSFFKNALGKERFLTIDKVTDDGTSLYGDFQAGNWGTFHVFFKFRVSDSGKFDRLDIGQTDA